jgi:hypothetical protein
MKSIQAIETASADHESLNRFNWMIDGMAVKL